MKPARAAVAVAAAVAAGIDPPPSRRTSRGLLASLLAPPRGKAKAGSLGWGRHRRGRLPAALANPGNPTDPPESDQVRRDGSIDLMSQVGDHRCYPAMALFP